jgi:hypothetical protein
MDPQAFEQMNGGFQNHFDPGYMVEEDQMRGVLNRFSLSRVHNK